MACFPTLLLFDASNRESLELDETYPAKTRGMGLPYSENFIILNRFCMIHSCDGQTAGRAIAYSALSIYAICCRALKTLLVNQSINAFISGTNPYHRQRDGIDILLKTDNQIQKKTHKR